MITFRLAQGRFNFRTAGIIIDSGRVLVHRGESDPFWTLPGGRVEFAEDTASALVREMREELGVDVRVERLLWVVENFFEYDGSDYHEIAMYFALVLPDKCDLLLHTDEWRFYEEQVDTTIIFRWVPLDEITELELYPSFLKQGLLSLPHEVGHIVHRDMK